MSNFEFSPIGYVESCFIDRFGTPRQPHLVPSSRAQLKIRNDLNPVQILSGLEGFTYVWIIFVFHLNTNKLLHPKIHPPRLGGKTIGIFASRSPHRPNPIGLSLAKIDNIAGETLHLREIDLLDGTPVLDIKPYVSESDSKIIGPEGWVQEPWKPLAVTLESQARSFLHDNKERIPHPPIEIENLIYETLSQDPRPQLYKGDGIDPSPLREDYWIYLYNLNIRFRYYGEGIHVEEIEFRESKIRK